MIRSSVTVSLVNEARGGPFVYWDDLPAACRATKELGFDGIEIFPPGPEVIEPTALKTLLADNGLALAAMGTGAGWVRHKLNLCLPDAAARTKARAFIRSIIDLAGPLGAPAIIGSMQGRSGGDGVDAATARGYLMEGLEELGTHAKQYGVPLIFEPLNRYETNMASTVEQGVTLVRGIAGGNVLLLADLFHMNIEETDLAGALLAGGPHIGHVHFVDSNRRPAGLGHLDFAPVAQALREMQYTGFVSAEALPYPDSQSAAEQTMRSFKKFFR